MNLQQLTYIIAIDRFRHFARAAEHCHVTQPTLSTMVNRMEREIGVKIFDRSRTPVLPTETGRRIIAQALRILEEVDQLHRLAGKITDQVDGELRLGVLPTVAPYLLPLFLQDMLSAWPKLRITINELTTDAIIDQLKTNCIDAGILATPLNNEAIREIPLYNEPFVVYRGKNMPVDGEQYIYKEDIDLNQLWVLEEGHCMRSQIAALCELKKKNRGGSNLHYETGSIEALKRLVDANYGITILPVLSIRDLTDQEMASVQHFHDPVPVREISIATYRHHIKECIVEELRKEIQKKVLPLLNGKRSYRILEI